MARTEKAEDRIRRSRRSDRSGASRLSAFALASVFLTTQAPGQQAAKQALPSEEAPDPIPYEGTFLEFESDVAGWFDRATDVESYAFDSFFPGVPGLAILTGPTAIMNLGSRTLSVTDLNGLGAVADGTSIFGAISDALLFGLGSSWRFSSPIYGFQTYYGSFQPGCAVTMKLYYQDALVQTLQRNAGSDPVAALGHGFLSDVPIDRIDFVIDCTDTVLVGAFVGLDPGEDSMGTVFIPGYGGPSGPDVELDFSFATTPLEPQCVQMISLPWTGIVSTCRGSSTENCESQAPSMSADGRFVAFISGSSILVPDDTNGIRDIFVRDRDPDENGVLDDTIGLTKRVSVDSRGAQGNFGGGGGTTSLSADGAHVAFGSSSTNLVAGDTNGMFDIFVHSRVGGQTSTVRVSVGPNDEQPFSGSGWPSLSGDGRFVVFHSGASNFVPGEILLQNNIFLRDRDTDADGIFDEPGERTTILLTPGLASPEGNAVSQQPTISADGRWVAFWSDAYNLVACDLFQGSPLDDGLRDIFLYDRDVDEDGVFDEAGHVSTTKITHGANALSDDPQISSDGRSIVFISLASNLVANDSDNEYDVFVHDIESGGMVMVSVTSDGVEVPEASGKPGFGANRDLVAISGDGRFVAFPSTSSSLVPGVIPPAPSPFLFVHDRDADGDGLYDETHPGARRTFLGGVDIEGEPATGVYAHPYLDADGSELVFKTGADLIPSLTNNTIDLFVVNHLGACEE